MSLAEWDERFLKIGAQLVRERRDTLRAVTRLQAARASTCEEVYRRLLRGRDFLLAHHGGPFA